MNRRVPRDEESWREVAVAVTTLSPLSSPTYSSSNGAVAAQYALVMATGPTLIELPFAENEPNPLFQSARSESRLPSANSTVNRSGSLTVTTVESERVID